MTSDDRSEAPASPRRRRKEARPQEIVEASLLEFAEKGFAAARLDDVAQRAGIVKGTIYRYFPSKEELFMAAVAARTRDLLTAAAAGPGEPEADARDQIAALVRRFYAAVFRSDLEVLIRIVLTEGRSFPALTAAYHAQVVSLGQDLLGRIVQRGIERGELRAGPASRLPMVLVAPVLMAVAWRMVFNRHQPLDLDAFADAHVDLVLNGLGLRPEP